MTDFRAALEAIRDAAGKSGRSLRELASNALSDADAERELIEREGREAQAEQDRLDAEQRERELWQSHGFADGQPPERRIEVEGPGFPPRWVTVSGGVGTMGRYLTEREKFEVGWCDGCATSGLRVGYRVARLDGGGSGPIVCEACRERLDAEERAAGQAANAEASERAAVERDRREKIDALADLNG
jgi:hypothetical protein